MTVCGANAAPRARRSLASLAFVFGAFGFGLFESATSASAQAPAAVQAAGQSAAQAVGQSAAQAAGQAAAQPAVQVPPGLRASRDTYDALMDVLKASRPRA